MNNLIIIEHKGSRVLTTQQLAEVYETDAKNIHMNYSNNTDRFLSGRDYFYLDGDSLKEFKNSLPNNIGEPLKFAPSLTLWTERGANRHSKILDTDKAWQQFDVLEETYFKAKSGNTNLPQLTQIQMLAEMARQMAEQEQMMLSAAANASTALKQVDFIRETIIRRNDENWREQISLDLNAIVKASGGTHQDVRSESYELLEERAACRLSVRVANARDRLREAGAKKTAIEKYCKLDAIEEDSKLKEIYTGIVKEMAICHLGKH